MELDTFIKIGLPISLGLIMLSMGMVLKTKDFHEVAKNPRAFFIGLSAQMLFVPLLALCLLQIFNISPLLSVGLLILSFSPGGTTSNLFSYLAKGDVALSIALTTAASIITPFSIPLLTEIAIKMQLGESGDITIPVALTMKRLFVVTLLPVIIGMSLRFYKSKLADRIQPVLHRLSVILFFAVIFSMIFSQWNKMPEFLGQVGLIVMTMIILAMLAGYYIAKITKLNAQQTRTISIEVGMQNGGMALIVTQSVLNNPTMSIVPVIYGLLMLIPVMIFVNVSQNETSTAI